MRRTVIAGVLTTGMVLGAVRPTASQAFSGTVHYTIHDENGKTATLTQATKPGHYAVQYTGDGKTGEFIVDSAAGTTTFVSSEDSSYFVITKEMAQMAGGMMSGMAGMMRRHGMDSSKADSDIPKATVTRTGSSVVAGIPCEVYHYDGMNDNKHVTGDVCLAKGVGMGLLNMNPVGGMMGGMGMPERRGVQDRLRQMGQVGVLLSQGYGILKATNIEDGKPKGSIEVTAVERGTPPTAAFAPPPGFKEKTMGDMMGGRRRP